MNLDELKELAEKAREEEPKNIGYMNKVQRDFLLACREVVPGLIKEIGRLREANEELREFFRGLI
jgi:hypothetical protein